MTHFAVLDLETTGEAPPAEILEIGLAIGVSGPETGNYFVGPDYEARLFKPNGPIAPDSRAVHHISPADVEWALPATNTDIRAFTQDADVLVAHNAAFERQWFTPEVIGQKPWICTYKAALRVWPDAPRHTNQVLRYWLADRGELPELERAYAEPAHRAGPDAWVTAYVLGALLKHASVDDMVRWADEPRLMPKITFGKHKGCRWSEVAYDYLSWIVFKSDMDEDTKWNAQREMGLRGARAH